MKIFFYSPVHFENWDWRNSVEKGIGGSETSHVEMAWRLARRGHEVVSYAPIPEDCPGEWRGTFWKRFEEADFTQDGLWIIYRYPAVIDKFDVLRPEQPRWLMCQDTWYPALTPERLAKFDKVIALCRDQADHLMASPSGPGTREKIWMTSNGVKLDLMREVERAGPIARNPKKLVYASSPDRGLKTLLQIFGRAREIVPDLELSVFYGWNNIDSFLATGADWTRVHLAGVKEEIKPLLEQPGVTWRGRVSQTELYREWLSAGLWVYPTDFTETSCITCMEAQVLGAIPITRPLWALRDNIRFGVFIDGSPTNDALVRARYVGEIVRMVTFPEIQEKLRGPMMQSMREAFGWERWVDQWEAELFGWGSPIPVSQFNFQFRHVRGRTLNVGCDADTFGLARRLGTVNMDIREESPVTKQPNAVHVIHDAREPYPGCVGTFDTVILGDIMEHLSEADGIKALQCARDALREGGQIVITVPNDVGRPHTEQHFLADGSETYAEGISAFHDRAITLDDLDRQLQCAGLRRDTYQPLDYGMFEGHALVATRRPDFIYCNYCDMISTRGHTTHRCAVCSATTPDPQCAYCKLAVDDPGSIETDFPAESRP